jgi:hypothetical protein
VKTKSFRPYFYLFTFTIFLPCRGRSRGRRPRTSGFVREAPGKFWRSFRRSRRLCWKACRQSTDDGRVGHAGFAQAARRVGQPRGLARWRIASGRRAAVRLAHGRSRRRLRVRRERQRPRVRRDRNVWPNRRRVRIGWLRQWLARLRRIGVRITTHTRSPSSDDLRATRKVNTKTRQNCRGRDKSSARAAFIYTRAGTSPAPTIIPRSVERAERRRRRSGSCGS